jgi:RNA polymerase sigma factor (sigma-70 family)
LSKLLAVMEKRLTERELRVIRLHYFDEKTLQEIGNDFGITRERVRQIEVGALKKLHKGLSADIDMES